MTVGDGTVLLRQLHYQRWALLALALLTAIVALLSIAIGPVTIPPRDILLAIGGQLGLPLREVPAHHEAVITAIRLPRTVLGLVVGAGLAVAGAAMQGLFRNPLAEPQLIGVSSGAALGAIAMIVLGSGLGLPAALQPYSVSLAAITGALLVTASLYLIASRRGSGDVTTMLLIGIAINAIAAVGIGLFTWLAVAVPFRGA